jgi:hypothetical protein
MSNNPSWLDSEHDGGASTANNSSFNAPAESPSNGVSSSEATSGGGMGQEGPKYKRLANNVMTFTNMGMAVFMAATGALGIMGATKTTAAPGSKAERNDAQDVFVGVYMCLFAAILFFFELANLSGIKSFINVLKRNFGFLYGKNGKCVYIIFMAIMSFGLTQPKDVALACGIIVGTWGPVQVAYYCRFPDHYQDYEKYKPEVEIRDV